MYNFECKAHAVASDVSTSSSSSTRDGCGKHSVLNDKGCIIEHDHGDCFCSKDTKFWTRSSVVRFANPLITATIYRPFTRGTERERLYYSRADFRRFKRDKKVEEKRRVRFAAEPVTSIMIRPNPCLFVDPATLFYSSTDTEVFFNNVCTDLEDEGDVAAAVVRKGWSSANIKFHFKEEHNLPGVNRCTLETTLLVAQRRPSLDQVMVAPKKLGRNVTSVSNAGRKLQAQEINRRSGKQINSQTPGARAA